MVLELKRTDRDDPEFLALVELLDADLWARYPETQQDYAAGNRIAAGAFVVVARDLEACAGGLALGCACVRELGPGRFELKRMFVRPERRGSGLATAIVRELEAWAAELGAKELVLETGIGQPEAIRLYEKSGFARIPNYGEYAGMSESVCMAKKIA